MGDISKLNVGGTLYDIKDAKARTDVSDLKEDITEVSTQIVGINIFDSSEVEEKSINSSGVIASATGFYLSKPYPVYPNAVYEVANSLGSSGYLNLAFFDDSGQFISGATDGIKKVFVAPSNARTARVCGAMASVSSQKLCCIVLKSSSDNAPNTFVLGINGNNVFDVTTIEEGKAFGSTGQPFTNSAAYISDFIPVIPNGKYKIGAAFGNASFANAVVYSKTKELVSVVDGLSKIASIPSTGYYIKLSGILTAKNNQSLHYINYYDEQIDAKFSDADNVLIGSDLFISANAETGKFFDNSGNPTTNVAGYISDYIRVIPNAEYAMLASVTSPTSINAVIYDSDKVKLASNYTINGVATRFTIPPNGAYVRLNGLLANISKQGFFLVPYNLENVCAGKRCICYGDSLTEYDGNQFTSGVHQGETCVGFESYMRKDLKMSWVFNRGGSGMTTPEFIGRLLSEVSNVADYDYMTIMGGDNDDRLDVSVGEIAPIGSTFDDTTVIGALQKGIEQSLAVNPSLRIVMMTEPIGWTGRNVGGVDTLVRVQEKYPQAYRDVAAFYGIPLIDLWNESGINELNRNYFYADVSDDTNVLYMYHPYNTGWKRISQLICMAFRSYERGYIS